MNKLIITTLCLIFGFSTLSADTVTMIDGKTYEGAIMKESNQTITLRHSVGKGVWEWSTIERKIIKSVVKVMPDQHAFKEIQHIVPTPDFMNAEWYQTTLDKKIRHFINKFPKSAHLADVKKMELTLDIEAKAVAQGGLKYKGIMYSPTEVKQNFYSLESNILANQIDQAIKKKHYRNALNLYNQLQKKYKISSAAHTVSKKMPAMLRQYDQLLQSKEKNHPKIIATTQKAIKIANEKGNRTIKIAHLKQEARFKERIFDEMYIQRVKWLSVWERDLASIQKARKQIISFKKELAGTLKRPNQMAGERYASLFTSIKLKDFNSTQQTIAKLRAIGFPSSQLNAISDTVERELLQLRRAQRLTQMKKAFSGYTMDDVLKEERQLNQEASH